MQYTVMPPSRTGRRPKRSDSGPITNWPTPKPIRNVDSTACGRLATAMWNAEAIFGSAGSIMSIASGFRAMIDAITMTNSGNPIGRWLDETQASALMSVTVHTSRGEAGFEGGVQAGGGKAGFSGYAAPHNPSLGMAAHRRQAP